MIQLVMNCNNDNGDDNNNVGSGKIILKTQHVINCNNGIDDNSNVGSGKNYLEMLNFCLQLLHCC